VVLLPLRLRFSKTDVTPCFILTEHTKTSGGPHRT